MIETTCCFTGHRVLPAEQLPAISRRLAAEIRLLADSGIEQFCSGGALGFDLLAAEEVLSLRRECLSVKLILVLPCHNQDSYWSAAERARYRKILSQADEVEYTALKYFQGCMHVRNRRLVERSSQCVAYLTEFSGGTRFTVEYALSKGLNVINLAEFL